MRTTLIAAVALSVGLAVVGPARAGVYSVSEGPPNPFDIPTFPAFQLALGEARSIAFAPAGAEPSAARARYLKRVEALEAKEKGGKLTVADRIDLSACYHYLRRDEDAERVLAPAYAEEPTNFMVLANLGTVSQGTDLTRA